MKFKTISILACICIFAFGFSFEENTALQYQSYIKPNTTAKRREELREWLKTKRPLRENPKDKYCIEFSANGFAFAVDESRGYPVKMSVSGSENLIANYSATYPLFELHFVDKAKKNLSVANYGVKPTFRKLETGLEMTWKMPEATVTTFIGPNADGFAQFDIKVENVSPELRLDHVDYPMLAIKPRGNAETNCVVIPDRRGRLRPLTELWKTSIKEYPCSNARFQMTAFYDNDSKKGVYFAAQDINGWEKNFIQTYIPEYKLTFLALRRYPMDRGRFGNSLDESFPVVLATFDGDWYDAAQIYRKWTLRQPWAKNGPLYTNKEIPEFIKRAPVWIRFYLRASANKTPAQVEKMSKQWADFLPDRKFPAELFHYSDFKEPDFKSKYPVSEYYGYKARPFPGLPETLKKIDAMGVKCCVFLQSEIINQFNKENDALIPAYKVDVNGKPRLYLDERNYVCRMSPIWQERTDELVKHLLGMGFTGIYLDTFAKSKPDFECFSPDHGHPQGGGNTDFISQHKYGERVRKLGRSLNPDFYMIGEACTEPYMDILDVKENATHTDPDAIFLERTIYGDYFLPHGRTISNSNVSYTKFLGLDFLNGMIPGRFFDPPPTEPHRIKVLRDVIDYTDSGYEYVRCGQMLRALPFAKMDEKVIVEEMNNKIEIAKWQNSVFHSCKDNTIAIYVFNFGDEQGKNTLLLPDGKEWNATPNSKVFRMDAKGEKTLLGTLGKLKEIPLDLPADGIEAFLIIP